MKRFGTNINDLTIQDAVLNAVSDFMGSDMWKYTKHSGLRFNKRAELLQVARQASGFILSYRTLMRWIDYYQKYGEAPARARRNRKPTRRRRHTEEMAQFTGEDEDTLKTIIDNQPQLYLDEIRMELFYISGELWSTSTIWKKLHLLGYSLKVAVFRAKQQNEQEKNDYYCRLEDRVRHPSQLLIIDESAKDANAARRRRAWSPLGVTPIIDAPMVREFDKRYTLIGACNWDGFIPEACEIVEREHGKNDNNPNRGTVDTERFEQYLEECLVPVLGKYEFFEPNSIVVMDNASIHNSVRVKEIIEGAGALLVYTAPYSPEINPIEYMFGEYKKALKRHSNQPGYDWIAVHDQAIRSVTPPMAKQFYKHCKMPMIEEWMEQQEDQLEQDGDFLPYPFNDCYEYLMGTIY